MSQSPRNDARQLRKLNFDLANYFSNTIIPQLFVDADLILRIFTPPAMEQFSLSQADVNRSIHEVKDNIRYPTIVENIQEVIATNKILEKEIQTTDGNWFQMNMVPYIEHEENRTNGVLVTFVDITRRVESVKELEKLNADHDVLMFALAHDIRQPISTVTLLADALQMAFETGDAKKFNKWIKTLKTSARSLQSLIIDFTSKQDENPTRPNESKRLNIQEIAEDVLLALKEDIKTKKIQIKTDFNVTEIQFPRNNLRSILYNLVHNAIKFRSPERTSEIRITTTKVRGSIILCVDDNGVGIAGEHQRKIFKKSSRLNRNIKGTGMGLYIIKKMIENNEGRIKVESTSGEGTSFKVFFKDEYPQQQD